MLSELAKTPLHAWHAAHGGRLVDFAGWSMPVQYGSIVAEHQATRTALGLFDVSHMGRLRLDGPAAASFLNQLVTRRVDDLAPGQIRYGLVTNNSGGILDDVLVYHLASAAGNYHLLVVNASNRQKIVGWIESRLAGRTDVRLTDRTADLAMIAVQGPLAVKLLQPLVAGELASMKYYSGCEDRILDQPGIVSRTGYTGEDGFELMVPSAAAEAIWTAVLDAGKTHGALAAGLGCRDTLRLEAAMPLYGHELSEKINPLEAGLDFAVDLDGRQFPGRDALARFKQIPLTHRRVGLTLSGRRVPRELYPVMFEGRKVGEVTSGTFSPTLDRPIAMAYVEACCATIGKTLQIDIRGQSAPAEVVKLPFYRRAK